MSDTKGDSKQHLSTPSSVQDPDDQQQPTENISQQQQQHHGNIGLIGAAFVPTPLFNISSHVPGSFEQQQLHFEAEHPKRPRYTAPQWKLSPSTSSQQTPRKRPTQSTSSPLGATESSPASPTPTHHVATNQQTQVADAAAASSSDTASSPSHSHRPSHSAASGHEATNSDHEPLQFQLHQQFRKGKYVSPVWRPNEMLWLARAWRLQYQGSSSSEAAGDVAAASATSVRGKSRKDKDRQVAEFLNQHGVSRDAKTAGTKWDNMLGEFRKVYEWERGGERDQVGKSYFRLSPYERKLHRLPASFDEEVFEELSQFMASRMRTPPIRPGLISSTSTISPTGIGGDYGRSTKPSLTPPPPHHEEDLPLHAARLKHLNRSDSGIVAFTHGGRSGGGTSLGFETSLDHVHGGGGGPSSSAKEIRRIGKIRMTWEESVSLWADQEGEQHHRGRMKVQGSSFLNADEITFLDDSMVGCPIEAFEDGPLKGLSVDTFLPGQQLKVFGRRKSLSHVPAALPSGSSERVPLHVAEPSNILNRYIPAGAWEFQDPSEYYLGCLRVPPPTLPSLFELSWHLQEPPPVEFRFPVRKDVYKDLPQGKELFFFSTSSGSGATEVLDCRAIAYDILSAIMRPNPSLSGATASSRDSYIGLWDDCINRIVSKFCPVEMVFVRKSSSPMAETVQDEWPNVTGFLKNFCLWRGEEADALREDQMSLMDPCSAIVAKLLWTYADLPYLLGYYAVGYIVTFCAISRSSQDRITRTDLYTVDLSTPMERLKALVPCWRMAGLLSLLADRCCCSCFTDTGGSTAAAAGDVSSSYTKTLAYYYSDFERIDLGNGSVLEMTPTSVTRLFSSKRRWAAVKEIYDFLDHRIPHAEYIVRSSERDLGLVLKPRGWKSKPTSCDQLIEALKQVTEALVALHDLSFMHRDLGWDKVMRRSVREVDEWFITGFDEAMGAPQIYPHGEADGSSGRHAPEMVRGLHGVKVDVWGVGQLVKTCGLVALPKLLRELQNRCLDHNPEQRPTAADCYRHLLQLQTNSMSAAAAAGARGGY